MNTCQVELMGKEIWGCRYHNATFIDMTHIAEHVVRFQYKVDDSHIKLGGASDSSQYSEKLSGSRDRPNRQRKNYLVSRDKPERQRYR